MEMDRTVGYRPSESGQRGQCVTLFDGTDAPFLINLDEYEGNELPFGRQEDNAIVLHSQLVSRHHGRFVRDGGKWSIEDLGSRNGLICNDTVIRKKELVDGDIIRIDDGKQQMREGVLLVVSSAGARHQWKSRPLAAEPVTIGRSEDCSIVLPHPSVSRKHAVLQPKDGGWVITDNKSTNGVLVNGAAVRESAPLHEKDVITITNSKLIFTSGVVYYYCYRGGISVEVRDLVIQRGKGAKARVTTNHVNLSVRPGELVAIIGGSGAGKSTLLNAMCGYLTPASGTVSINGVDLNRNFEAIKQLVGYVPQSDIVYDDLTVEDMLKYAADLRLPRDSSRQEREEAINRAIETVELTDRRGSYIRTLSGGQRKRASIAVELLSDPNLLYLDEPASGLDPGTERNLMHSLRQMADAGKTVVLVTHSTLQLKMCDRIVIMGRGGNLCFYGSYDEAMAFFGVDDIVDIYAPISEQAGELRDRYAKLHPEEPAKPSAEKVSVGRRGGGLAQLGVLFRRALKLITNDRQRLLLLLVQAPILSLLISLVADGNQFKAHSSTKSLLFALACAAFWVGMLNAIQEICKERTILKREYMAGLSLNAYMLSKVVVLALLCVVQSALMLSVFLVLVGGMPAAGVVTDARLEIYVTILLSTIAAASTGLLVSALVRNADKAMTLAPILLMPQILFSGLAFALTGVTEKISWLTACRWAVEGLGTSANLNALTDNLRIAINGIPFNHALPYNNPMFAFNASHLFLVWGILAAYSLALLLAGRLALARIKRENS